jgi:hypothetical protein
LDALGVGGMTRYYASSQLTLAPILSDIQEIMGNIPTLCILNRFNSTFSIENISMLMYSDFFLYSPLDLERSLPGFNSSSDSGNLLTLLFCFARCQPNILVFSACHHRIFIVRFNGYHGRGYFTIVRVLPRMPFWALGHTVNHSKSSHFSLVNSTMSHLTW